MLHRHELVGPITVLDTLAGGVAVPWSVVATMPISLDVSHVQHVSFTLYVRA